MTTKNFNRKDETKGKGNSPEHKSRKVKDIDY